MVGCPRIRKPHFTCPPARQLNKGDGGLQADEKVSEGRK